MSGTEQDEGFSFSKWGGAFSSANIEARANLERKRTQTRAQRSYYNRGVTKVVQNNFRSTQEFRTLADRVCEHLELPASEMYVRAVTELATSIGILQVEEADNDAG